MPVDNHVKNPSAKAKPKTCEFRFSLDPSMHEQDTAKPHKRGSMFDFGSWKEEIDAYFNC